MIADSGTPIIMGPKPVMDMMASLYGGVYSTQFGAYIVICPSILFQSTRHSLILSFVSTGELQQSNIDAQRYIHHQRSSFHIDAS